MVLVGKQDTMEALLNEQGIQLQGEIGSGILWSKDDAYARVWVQSAQDVYVGWVLESPHQEEVPQTFHDLPRLHHHQAERPKGF